MRWIGGGGGVDLMAIRRRMLMQIGGKAELWNRAVITVPNNMATSGDIYTWLTTAGVLPNYNCVIFIIRDNADLTAWVDNDFIEASWLKDQTAIPNLNRVRTPQNTSRYLQARNPVNNPTDSMNVYQGETFTVFYQ